ncbi:MAG: SAM-dependent methyltransferase, partial [Gammaproteobacteria bacterium]|nr:SAM-dependent methyltransferase [Gammaproteobacteria bacterium]
FRLVRAVQQANFTVTPIPGACAAIAALSASGIPTDRFIFEGFLPAKISALENHLEKLKAETRTIIFYESVHRIAKTLPVMQKIFGDERVAVVARELTKSFETIKQGNLKALSEYILGNPEKQKGEFVIVLSGAVVETHSEDKLSDLLIILLSELSVKQAVSLAVKMTGINKNIVYNCALKIAEGNATKC